MNRRTVWMTLILCMVIGFGIALIPDTAVAQKKAVSADKGQAAKETGTLGSKEIDEDQLPGKKEVGLAIGSTIAMIAVMKYW